MSKKDTKNKKNKKPDIQKAGVNRVWDALFALDGIEKVFEAIPNEEAKKEILNFTAGLSEKFAKQIDNVEKNLTPDQARKLYAAVARDLGKSQKEISETVSNLEENQQHMEERIRRELKKKDAEDEKNDSKE